MGTVTILDQTTTTPVSLIGEMAGVCWDAPVDNEDKNVWRGWDCIKSNHGRVIEFPDIYMVLDGYSARVIREFYTHIGGSPTRLQASTRYIPYGKFQYITPPSLKNNDITELKYHQLMSTIMQTYRDLELLGVPKEDIANILPLGMETKVVVRINPRTLMDMSRNRKCTRAYWEFRQLFNDIEQALKNYSEQWGVLSDELFKAKCEVLHYCPEKNSCGRYCSKTEFENKLIELMQDNEK